tara:strand:+ start:934 stop:2166 length:1233 start_codon:yes stop_codon:yes gene_type:complete
MATNLDELSLLLNQGAQASGNLAGLDEQYERANALRDQPIQEMRGNATGTGLSAIANLMNSYTGNKRAAAIEPQRATAREQMAGAKNALPMYQAQKAEEATALAAQNRLQDQQDKKEAALLLATAQADAMNNPVTYVSPDGTGEITGYPTKGGGLVDNSGVPIDISGKVPYTDYATAINKKAKTGANAKGFVDPMAKVGAPSLIASILDSDDLAAATGTADPSRWLGKFGYDTADFGLSDDVSQGERIQALQSKMSDVGINTVKTNLEGLGINPTDKDLEVAFASIPDAGTQPLAWAVWVRDQYLPALIDAGGRSVAAGTADSAQIATHVQQIEESMQRALAKYGDQPEPRGRIEAPSTGPKVFKGLTDANFAEWEAQQAQKRPEFTDDQLMNLPEAEYQAYMADQRNRD